MASAKYAIFLSCLILKSAHSADTRLERNQVEQRQNGGNTFRLKDDSRVIGSLQLAWTAEIHTLFGKAKIPASYIREIKHRSAGGVTLYLKNGDRVSGKLSQQGIRVQTRYGSLNVPVKQLVCMRPQAVRPTPCCGIADFERKTKKSLAKGKVSVAVLTYAPTKLKLIDPSIDKVIARRVAKLLRSHGIKLASTKKVENWIEANPDWETPQEVGIAVKADYVIYIDLQQYDLFERGNRMLYRGRATFSTSVIEIDSTNGIGERIYARTSKCVYPLAIPRSSRNLKVELFRRSFIDRISNDIKSLFCASNSTDE